MSARYRFFLTTPTGLADLAAKEAIAAGASDVRETVGGVEGEGTLEVAYRCCLWSRVANRVLLVLTDFEAPSPEALYEGVGNIDWTEHIGRNATIACDFSSKVSAVSHTQFGAQTIKDAIVDQLRIRHGERPNVETTRPDLRINVRMYQDRATLSLDLSGESLHRRGYREESVAASLKENLAAGLLLRAGWMDFARSNASFIDPMCGSGTLPIEAALIACNIAPGLARTYYGFFGWLRHDRTVWEQVRSEAREVARFELHHGQIIAGFDLDERAVAAARASVSRAGLETIVTIERRALAALKNPGAVSGLVVTNPPYGVRMGGEDELRKLYIALGERLREEFGGWHAAVLTANPGLGRRLGIVARRTHTLFNGPLECRLLRFEISPKFFSKSSGPEERIALREQPGALAFANRLRKNLRTIGTWAERSGIQCYRLYDADMPEYAFAIDLYGNHERWAYVQEYEAPKSIDASKARERRNEMRAVVSDVLGFSENHVIERTRRRQKGREQYTRFGEAAEYHEVREGGLRFLVNFSDHLDTGLFLDHRLTRGQIRELSKGANFLNLFGYTGTATVYAAAGGARLTTTIDLSSTYLAWARRNLALNQLDGESHELIRADCLEWLRRPWPRRPTRRYDLIFIDPPTFSRSKRTVTHFGVQRDHVELIRRAATLLAPGGRIFFSNNFRRFRLEQDALSGFEIEDITHRTIPRDFSRNRRIHQCYVLWPGPRFRF